MKVKYSDNDIKRVIVKFNDVVIDVIDGYYLIKDGTDGYYYSLDKYLHTSEYAFSTLEELKSYLKLKERTDKNEKLETNY